MSTYRHALGAIVLGAALALVVAAVLSAPRAFSAGSGPINGWAWSDTVGWIQLNCQTANSSDPNGCTGPAGNWGLVQNSDTTISGYAWSEYVGWIAADTGGACGAVPVTDGTNFTGFLKVANPGAGWDGCIKLYDTLPFAPGSYQVKKTGLPLANPSSYDPAQSGAWGGSDVIGWVAFNPVLSCAATNWTGTVVNGQLQCSHQNDSCSTETQICTSSQVCDPSGGCIGSSAAGCIKFNPDNSCAVPTPVKTTVAQPHSNVNVYWQVAGVEPDGTCKMYRNGVLTYTGNSGALPFNDVVGRTVASLSCDNGAFTDAAVINMPPGYREI